MGLERTTAVLDDRRGPYETDLFAPTLARLQEISGKTYTSTDDSLTDIAFRRIADHVRATTFLIGDGVMPSNTAQGYVLRRLMRRAMLAGRRVLGIEKPFLADAIPAIVEQYQDVYPECWKSATRFCVTPPTKRSSSARHSRAARRGSRAF